MIHVQARQARQSTRRKAAFDRLISTMAIAVLLSAAILACGDDGSGSDKTTPDVASDIVEDDTDTSRPEADVGEDVAADVTEDVAEDVAEDTPTPDVPTPDAEVDVPPDVPVNGPPRVLEVSPNRGPVTGGTSLLLVGLNFSDDAQVFLGARRLQDVEVLSSTEILGTTPPGSLGAVDVKVFTERGEDVVPDGFRYFNPLRIDTVTPNRSSTLGGDVVLVRGGGFSEDTTVTFGGRIAVDISFLGPETLQATTPPGEAGLADVRVSDRDSSALLANGLRYVEPLDLERIFPASGPTAGGTVTTLYGSGFTVDTIVRFGDILADTTFVSATELTAVTPPGPAGFVDVSISNADSIAGLVRAFYYAPASDEVRIAGMSPEIGPASGGTLVTIVGSGFDGADLDVEIGASDATVLEVSATTIVATTPAGTVGLADLDVSTDEGSDTLPDAFEYRPDVTIDDVTPNTGPIEGGGQATITGSGFSLSSLVRFGSQRAPVVEASDSSLTVTVPPGTIGSVDLTVQDHGIEAVLSDGYTYEAEIEVYGLQPTKGSIAGGTFVIIRGAGFTAAPTVIFGEDEATDVELIDAATISVRTPPGREGTVNVALTFPGETVISPDRYTYFNPGSLGGVWGDAINGAVNVAVYNIGGAPIENAYVILNTDVSTPYQGWTDANGQVTFSGPDLSGAQTVTAVAAGHSSATVQSFNSENVTLLLSPLDGQGQPPPGPPTGTITGYISGVEKVGLTGPNEFELAIVFTTQTSPFRANPPEGGGNTLLSNGEYTLISRTGDVAVVAVAGIYNNLTETFTPLYMAIRRGLFVEPDGNYVVDLDMNIPLNNPITFKVNNSPRGPNGPTTNMVFPYLDLGFEGVFGGIDIAEGDEQFVTAAHQPELEGVLSDASFFVYGGAITDLGGEVGAPYSFGFLRQVTDTDGVVELPTLVGTPEPITPQDGGLMTDNYVEFDPNTGDTAPDFYFVNMFNLLGAPVWSIILPGDEPYFQLPDFPDFTGVPDDQVPDPFVGGIVIMEIQATRAIEFDYDNFDLNDFGFDNTQAQSLTGWTLRLR